MKIYDIDMCTGNIHYTLWDDSVIAKINSEKTIIEEGKIYTSCYLKIIEKKLLVYPKRLDMLNVDCIRKQLEEKKLGSIHMRKICARSKIYKESGYYYLRIYFEDGINVDITPYRISVIDGKPSFDIGKWQIAAMDVIYGNKMNLPRIDNNDLRICIRRTNDSYFPKLEDSDSNSSDACMNIVEAIVCFKDGEIERRRQKSIL